MILKLIKLLFIISLIVVIPIVTFAGTTSNQVPALFNIRIEFILFGLTLIGIALFHNRTLWIAISGLALIVLFKLTYISGFHWKEHFLGENLLIDQIFDKEKRQGEWGILLNLLGLLLGFAILAKIFEESKVPDVLPKYLPDDWKGPFVLLIFVFILSSFLDNIAAAMIGGTIALVVFKHKVHIGFIAAIVASSNAGGAGSVVGDTTTTMMWIDGVSAMNVFHAYISAIVALLIIAWFASHQQDKYKRIMKDPKKGIKIDYWKIFIVLLILVGAIATNIFYDMPALGVWIAIFIGASFRKIPWNELKPAVKGTIFLLSLVTAASMMPVETLPDASWKTAFLYGFVSAVFDNIPLTKLCLDQGHYDWGMLAYSVGFGGSMIWFGSSAGVAITNKFSEARDVKLWIHKAWYIIVAYIVGFFILLFIMGWEPASNKKHTEPAEKCRVENCHLKMKN